MKIGDTVWLHDENRRQYDARGKRLERYAFFPTTIVAENRATWITQGHRYRIDKKTGRLRRPHRDGYFGLSPDVWESEAAVDEWCWQKRAKYPISQRVLAANASQLRAIMGVLGLTDADVVDN